MKLRNDETKIYRNSELRGTFDLGDFSSTEKNCILKEANFWAELLHFSPDSHPFRLLQAPITIID